MAKKTSKETNLIVRCIKAPVKFLVEVMSACSSVGGSTVMGSPAPQFSTLHRNFRVNSLNSRNDQSLRAAQEIIGRQQSQTLGATVVPWSQGMGMGRIDEERSCEFGDDD